MVNPLKNIRVLALTINLPGPLAAARLAELGATVTKVEPPTGDPLAVGSPEWYRDVTKHMSVLILDLKEQTDRGELNDQLGRADLLLTAMRPAALRRLGVDWSALHVLYPRLCHVAIVGYSGDRAEQPGHDLVYQAQADLLTPPQLPRALIADIGGAQEAVTAALTLILARERGEEAGYQEVSLADVAMRFGEPYRHGLTKPAGPLAGGRPGYDIYPTRDGWVAVAALEDHFLQRLSSELKLTEISREGLKAAFLTRTACEWEAWGVEQDLPIARVP